MRLLSHLGGDGHGWRQGALRDLDRKGRDIDLMFGANDRRVLQKRPGNRFIQRFWQQFLYALSWVQTLWVDPDDLPVAGDADFQHALGCVDVGSRLGQRGLGLSDVCPSHFTNIETIAGEAQLLVEHRDIALAQRQYRRVAQHVHVGGGGRLKDGLLRLAHGGARGEH